MKDSNQSHDYYNVNGPERDNDNVLIQQIRVSFRLSPEYNAKQQLQEESSDEFLSSLMVPSEAIAVPGHLTRKGLSAVINHLIGRDSNDENHDEAEENDSKKKSPLDFEFLVGDPTSSASRRFLRTSLDKHVRQNGLSLEQTVLITYFPSMPTPSFQNNTTMPDWISALVHLPLQDDKSFLISACYDGSLVLLKQQQGLQSIANVKAHSGPIKCLDARIVEPTHSKVQQQQIWMATGSMDHSVALHNLVIPNNDSFEENNWNIRCHAVAQHSASVSTIRFGTESQAKDDISLISGDWDGGVFCWRFNPVSDNNDPVTKKQRAAVGSSSASSEPQRLIPTISLQAHNSKVSGLALLSKSSGSDAGSEFLGDGDPLLVTSSWDHAIKVWNLERQDCLLTLNSSRVVSCLDASVHSPGICVTGHPDCTLRLWDIRLHQNDSLVTTENSFRPSHKAWISQVVWSRHNPYHVYSSSHDGTVKLWDLRSFTPLQTLAVFGKNEQEKILAMAISKNFIFVGGTTRTIEQYGIQL